MKIHAKCIKIIDTFAIHIFSRKQTGKHDNKYAKIIKNGTVFAKYLLVDETWEDLHKDVPKSVSTWVVSNVEYLLNEIKLLDT